MVRKRKSKERKSTLKKILFAGLFFCFLAAALYLIIWSPYFWIKQIQVESEEEAKYFQPKEIQALTKQILEEKFWQFFPLKSVFLVSEDRIKKQIFERFPGIDSIEVQIELPDKIGIKIQQREKIGIWCQAEYQKIPIQNNQATTTQELDEREIERIQERRLGDCFEIDSNGIIFKKSALVKGEMILNIFSQVKKPILGEQVLSAESINFIRLSYQELKQIRAKDNKKLAVSQFEVFSKEDIRAETRYGWKIYFNPKNDLVSQINALERVLIEEVENDYLDLEYMDLRIQGRVYYK